MTAIVNILLFQIMIASAPAVAILYLIGGIVLELDCKLTSMCMCIHVASLLGMRMHARARARAVTP